MTKLDKYKDLIKLGGPQAVADMLNVTEPKLRKTWLSLIRMENPEMAEKISSLMFTFDDLAKISDRDMQTLIRNLDYNELLTAMKIASSSVRAKILANFSENQRKVFKEDFLSLPKHRTSHVLELQKKIIALAKELETKNEINLNPEGDKLVE